MRNNSVFLLKLRSKKYKSDLTLALVSLLTLFSFLSLPTAFAQWNSDSSAPRKMTCDSCPRLSDEIEQYSKTEREANDKLKKLKNDLSALPADQDAQKMRYTSKVFVLAANAESAENYRIAKEKEWKLVCSRCPKKSK